MVESTTNLYEVPEPSRCMACDAIQLVEDRGTYKKAVRPQALRFGARIIPPESLKRRPF